jgi:5-methylcytosine-specific restriction endonuclease McrA
MTRAEWAKRKGRSSSRIRKSLRFAIFARDNFDCVYCRQVFPPPLDGAGLTLDHVIPRSKGGKDRADNMVTACARCNSSRQDSGRVAGHGAMPPVQKANRARLHRQLRKPINRELGRWLAAFAKHAAPRIDVPVFVQPTPPAGDLVVFVGDRRVTVPLTGHETGRELADMMDTALAQCAATSTVQFIADPDNDPEYVGP